jgi:hypothetical protein
MTKTQTARSYRVSVRVELYRMGGIPLLSPNEKKLIFMSWLIGLTPLKCATFLLEGRRI